MHVLKKTLISIIACSLLILSVGAEEPVKENTEAPLIYNTEEENAINASTGTTVVADENNVEDIVNNSAETDNAEVSTPENDSSESLENASEPVVGTPTVELGEFKTEVAYNEEHTVATVVITYIGECEELTLANQDIIQPLIEKGIYTVNFDLGNWVNTIAFDVYANGLISLDINIWDKSYNEPLGTKRVETTITDLKTKVEIKEVEVPVTYDITSNVEGSSSQASMNVTYTNVNSYNWTIPTDFDLNNGSKLTVSVTDPQISDEAALKIKVNSANNYKLVGANPENSNAMSYTITNENGVALNNESNNVALQYNMDTDTGTKSANLTFNYNSNEALYTDTYSDQLNFTAQVGLGSGTKINIGEKKYTIIEQTADNNYLVMELDSIKNIQWNPNQDENGDYKLGVYETPTTTRHDGQYSNLYEDSYIDKYLNTTYYNTLSIELQNAIVDTAIKQEFYSLSGVGNKWFYDKKSDSDGEWTGWWYNEGTSESPNWVRYYNHIPVSGNEGVYPSRCWAKQKNGYSGVESNEITRKIFLPSVDEVSKVINLSDEREVYNFLQNTDNSRSHLWLRDSRSGNAIYAINMDYGLKSLGIDYVTGTGEAVRPCYVLDLSKVSYTIEGKINFTINGITYKAKEGSTWEEWVNSKYNTLGYTIDSNGNISKNNMYVTNTNDINDKVSKSDVITADTAYYGSEFILTSGTKLTIGTKKYTVIEQKGANQYLLMERDIIGKIQYQPNQDENGIYNIGIYDFDVNLTRYDGQNSNLYENSYIDTYLSGTYINSLPINIQNAIVETSIKQNFYSQSGSNPLYTDRTYQPGTSEGETTCWYNEGTDENPNWVKYSDHIPQDGEEGRLPFKYWTKKDEGYNNIVPNELTRKVFLPSVEEISKAIDLNSQKDLADFLKNTNGSSSYLWLRDSHSLDATYSLILDFDYRSMSYSKVTITNVDVRPAYTLDLSGLDYIIE